MMCSSRRRRAVVRGAVRDVPRHALLRAQRAARDAPTRVLQHADRRPAPRQRLSPPAVRGRRGAVGVAGRCPAAREHRPCDVASLARRCVTRGHSARGRPLHNRWQYRASAGT